MSSLRKLSTLFWAVGMYTSTWKVWIDANIIFFLLKFERQESVNEQSGYFLGVDLSVLGTCVSSSFATPTMGAD